MPRDIPIHQQIDEVRREINMRKRVYARWVGERRMTQIEADLKIEIMEAVIVTLKKEQDRMTPGLGL